MAPALWVIAIVATLTVIHRILYIWKETKAGRTLPSLHPSLQAGPKVVKEARRSAGAN
jgi:hypothetical protein